MTNTKDRESKGGLRGAARFCAVQTVYSATVAGRSIEDVVGKEDVEIFLTEDIVLSEMDKDFFQRLLKTTADNLLEIDELIAKNLSDKWKMDRLDNVMKSILRLGTAELLYFEDVPAKVVFNEYIEISKSFFEKSEVAFINGLLNSVAKLR